MRRSIQKSFALLLSLVFLLALLPAGASAADVVAGGECGAEGSNLTWTLDADGVLTIEGTGAMADFQFSGAPWQGYASSEGGEGFMKSVIISDGVASIGSHAFSGCYSVESISIPGSVTSVGEGAFAYSTGLTSVVIPSSVTAISEDMFAYCFGLISVSIPDTVTSIGRSAFGYCMELAEMTLPKSLTSIGDLAFYGCHGLTSVAIPAAVTSIGRGAFWNCGKLAEIAVDPGNASYSSLDGVLFDKALTTLIQCPGGKLGTCSIPASVTSIGEGAFSYSYENGAAANITDVYYGGTEAQWAAIQVAEGNEPLALAAIHYGGTEEAPAPPAAPVVQVSTQKLAVDGVVKEIEHYNIDGSNYFKLRDLACLLIGTVSAFDVGYDTETRTVTVTTGGVYTPLPTDLQEGTDQSASAVVSSQALVIDGKTVNLTAYNIGNSNFFMLRDLAPYLDFGVNYDEETRTALIVTE